MLAELQSWSLYDVIVAPRRNAFGGCTATYDDYAVCSAWTYAYRVRANDGRVVSDASRVTLAIGPGTRRCGTVAVGGNALTVRTFRRDGAAPAVATDAPFVAIQDGSGAFTPVAPTALGLYGQTITDGAGRYGVAVACGASTVQLLQATLTEGATIDVTCASTAAGNGRTVELRKTSCQRADVTIGNVTWSGPCDPTATQSFAVPATPLDAGGLSFTNGVPERFSLERGVAGALVVADFAGPRSAPVDLRRVTVGPGVLWYATLFTPTLALATGRGTGPGDVAGLPAILRQATDIHRVCAGPFCHYLQALTDVDDSAQPAPVAPAATVTATGLTLAAPISGLGAQLQLGGWTVSISRGWLDRGLTYAYPRLCDLPGSSARCLDAVPRPAAWTLTGFTPVGAWSLVDVWNATQRPHAARDGLAYGAASTTGSL